MRVLRLVFGDQQRTCSEHCCNEMRSYVVDRDVPVCHAPEVREYGISILDGEDSPADDDSYETISFCPWCGAQLPEPLRELWFDRLEAMGVDAWGDDVPTAYQSDEWWRREEL